MLKNPYFFHRPTPEPYIKPEPAFCPSTEDILPDDAELGHYPTSSQPLSNPYFNSLPAPRIVKYRDLIRGLI